MVYPRVRIRGRIVYFVACLEGRFMCPPEAGLPVLLPC